MWLIFLGAVAGPGVDVGHDGDTDGMGQRFVEQISRPEGAILRRAGLGQFSGPIAIGEIG